MSGNPFEDGMQSYMARLRAIGKEAAAEGFNCVVMMSFEDPMRDEESQVLCGHDWGCFGSTYGTIGLMSTINTRVTSLVAKKEL